MSAPLRRAEPRKDGVTDAIASPSETPCRADAGDHLVFVNGPFYFDDLSGIACHVRKRRLVWLNIRSHADKCGISFNIRLREGRRVCCWAIDVRTLDVCRDDINAVLGVGAESQRHRSRVVLAGHIGGVALTPRSLSGLDGLLHLCKFLVWAKIPVCRPNAMDDPAVVL